MGEGFEEAGIVALMQADRGLVENIEHAGEAGADLGGEPDALALATRQRARGARQRKVVEADIDQEAQPLADFLEDGGGDLAVLGFQLAGKRVEPDARRADRHVGDLADMEAADLHGQRLGLQPIAAAGFARAIGLVARQFLAHPFANRFRASAARYCR